MESGYKANTKLEGSSCIDAGTKSDCGFQGEKQPTPSKIPVHFYEHARNSKGTSASPKKKS